MEDKERLARLEEEVEAHGSAIDHLVNTMDLFLPEQRRHSDALQRHEKIVDDAATFMASQRGAWEFIKRAGIVVAAISSAVGLILKIVETYPK